ncbi:MAG TPA: dihydroorotase [Candidatus Sulfotelmatobacter sp.]|nr:dihydroorotase [Candidatus Sulfotelmatobacter sp.]
MSGRRIAYHHARLLDPTSGLDSAGSLLTEGDRIVDFGPGKPFIGSDIEQVDCRGHALAPGLIDLQAHLREPGAEHQETLATAARAAAAGGITTMVAMPDTHPVIDEVALVGFIARRAAETACVRVLPAAALTRGLRGTEMTELGLLAGAGAVAFSDGDRAVGDALLMRRALSYARTFDALIMVHCQDPRLAGDGVMNEGEMAMRLGLAGIPDAAETIFVERDLRLVELTGGRWHATHLSCAEAIAAVRRAKARGLAVTCGAAPANFALNETAVGEYRTFAKVLPPLRAEADRKAVVAGLADGTIDVIASAHCPQDQESKRLPFAQAAFGVIGLETMLPLALELYHNRQVTLLRLLEAMTARPAAILRLPQGRLAKGAPADLIVIDLEAPWRIDEKKFRSKAKNSPFDGRPVQGRVVRTVVAGATVYDRALEG